MNNTATQKLTPEQAFQIIDQTLASLNLKREEHMVLLQALNVLATPHLQAQSKE